MTYNWQQAEWPNFRYHLEPLQDLIFKITEKMGSLTGKQASLPQNLQAENLINIIVEEAIKTSEIEGEYLSRPDIRSSIKNRLGLNQKTEKIQDRRANGITELMLDVRNTFREPLTEEKLFEWHLMLLSSSTNPNLMVGRWREHGEPMQVVSGHHGKWQVHYEAPPSNRVPKEMSAFFDWFNNNNATNANTLQFPPIRAAIAHLYFECIHPFEDGNGRIGRAIAEKALSQGFGYPVILSLSRAIEANKKQYYAALKEASKTIEITNWIQYFLETILRAQLDSEANINFILKKAKFFDKIHDKCNDRQMKVIKRMMEAGIKGFEGGMTARKYMIITDSSKATATRDLQDLLNLHALKQKGRGRSVYYELNLDNE